MPNKNGVWELKLTPIPCTICGWVGRGRYANRSTVCRYCRKRLMKALDEAKKLAKRLSEKAPTTMWITKSCINMGTQVHREAATEFNINARALLQSAKDAQEARATFVREKL